MDRRELTEWLRGSAGGLAIAPRASFAPVTRRTGQGYYAPGLFRLPFDPAQTPNGRRVLLMVEQDLLPRGTREIYLGLKGYASRGGIRTVLDQLLVEALKRRGFTELAGGFYIGEPPSAIVRCLDPRGHRLDVGALIEAIKRLALESAPPRSSRAGSEPPGGGGGGSGPAREELLPSLPLWPRTRGNWLSRPAPEMPKPVPTHVLAAKALEALEMRGSRSVAAARAQLDMQKFDPGELDSRWGGCMLAAPKRLRAALTLGRPHWRPDGVGAVARWAHRLKIDGRVYGRKRRVRAASFLVDCSGSMGGISHMLSTLERVGLRATVAGYGSLSGNSNLGVVGLYSYQGTRADEGAQKSLNSLMGGGNVVDGPALVWLGNQPSPRYWISDGVVTGQGDACNPLLHREAEMLCQKFRILRIEDSEELAQRLPWL